MKGRQIVLGHLGEREVAALMVDGVLEDLFVDPPAGAAPQPGAIFRARVDRPMPGQGGAFVSLDAGHGYLRGAKGLKTGASILVQIAGVAEAHKAPPVTQRLLFRSRYAIVTPGAPGLNLSRSIRDEAVREALLETAADATALREDTGLIVRSAAAHADPEDVARDIAAMASLADHVLSDAAGPPALLVAAPTAHERAWIDWADPPPDAVETGDLDALGVAEAVAAVRAPGHPLPGGARAWVERTRALTAVDVDTGAGTTQAAGLKATLAAVRALPRLARLKGLGGVVVVDPAPFPRKDRRLIEDGLRRAFRDAGGDVTLSGWTPLGHLELVLRRDRMPLEDLWP